MSELEKKLAEIEAAKAEEIALLEKKLTETEAAKAEESGKTSTDIDLIKAELSKIKEERSSEVRKFDEMEKANLELEDELERLQEELAEKNEGDEALAAIEDLTQRHHVSEKTIASLEKQLAIASQSSDISKQEGKDAAEAELVAKVHSMEEENAALNRRVEDIERNAEHNFETLRLQKESMEKEKTDILKEKNLAVNEARQGMEAARKELEVFKTETLNENHGGEKDSAASETRLAELEAKLSLALEACAEEKRQRGDIELKLQSMQADQAGKDNASPSGGEGNEMMLNMIIEGMGEELEKAKEEAKSLRAELDSLQESSAPVKADTEESGSDMMTQMIIQGLGEELEKAKEEANRLRAELEALRESAAMKTRDGGEKTAIATSHSPREETLQQKLARLKEQSVSPRKSGIVASDSTTAPGSESPAEKLARLKAQIGGGKK